ncbi:hypothetical protein E2562_018682 [Oryza meyeriana var. granulata]|uniref:Retroviral polymerase SH3-like domain-containing protein n=1 Tax=Oryza meyeriana var. granulata TaxID=110450 RepID=A0A6G1EMM5_9ORYZ|nr:hypothetical protein E2562_018682 [Oryza meyeriana var. granulata]
MVFLRYEPGTNAYRVYDPAAKRFSVTRDAVFDEAATWPWAASGELAAASSGDSFTVHCEVASSTVPPHPATRDHGTPASPKMAAPADSFTKSHREVRVVPNH